MLFLRCKTNKLLTICFVLLACNTLWSQTTSSNNTNREYTILFIGNSLTYTNNLPMLVEKEAKSKGFLIKTKTIANPNYAIVDHWNNGEVQKEISSKKYDYVIVQQGPSSQSQGKKLLIEYGKKLSDLCKRNNTKLCFFMVWPSLQYYYTFDGVIKNYREAATITNSLLCPVGEVWKTHFDATNQFDYYDSDGFHPSEKGSLIAARTIVNSIFN